MDALKTAIKGLLLEIIESYGSVQVPQREWVHLVHQSDGSVLLPKEQRPDYGMLITGAFAIYNKLPSYDALVYTIISDSKLSGIFLIDAAGNPVNKGVDSIVPVFTPPESTI